MEAIRRGKHQACIERPDPPGNLLGGDGWKQADGIAERSKECPDLGVLGSGLLRGVMIGVVISILVLLRRASRPHIAFLGRIPGTPRFSDIDRHADNECIPHVLIARIESSVLYFNAEHISATVSARIQSTIEPVKLVLFDFSNVPVVDLAGAEMLKNLHRELTAAGIDFRIVEARSAVRDFLRVEGLEERFGHFSRFTSLADALHEFESNRDATAESALAPAGIAVSDGRAKE